MKKFFAFCLLSLMMIFSSNCIAAKIPPAECEVREMIPYEGDVGLHAKYTANTAINLYDEPRSSKVIATLQAGDFATRNKSIVYSNPVAHFVKILRTIKVAASPKAEFRETLYEGDYVYLVMPLSKNDYLGWYNGRYVWWLDKDNISNFITPAVEKAWGEYQGEPTDINLGVEVWEYLKKEDGTAGWALTFKDGKPLNQLDRR